MPYTLVYSGGNFTVNDETLNNTTSLSIPGRNYFGYGVHINQNLVNLLENFASSSGGPSNSIRGQIWFNPSNNTLNYNTSTTVGTPTWVTLLTSTTSIDINTLLPSQGGQAGKFLRSNGTTVTWENPPQYTLPTATNSVLGGIKIGTGMTITAGGVVNVNPVVTGVTQIVAGSNITISPESGTGVVTIAAAGGGGGGPAYILPPATTTTLGGIKVGGNLEMSATGVLNVVGVGTLTSVGVTSSDLTVTGSPISTGSGTINLSLNTVPINKGGTGAINATDAINGLLPSQVGNAAAFLTSTGQQAQWTKFDSSSSTDGYTTLPGNVRLAWGTIDFGDVFAGRTTEIISYRGLFNTVYNVQVQLQKTSGAGGLAYPMIVSSAIGPFDAEVWLTETVAGNVNTRIMWQAIGSPQIENAPTDLNFSIVSWVDNGGTSTLTLSGSASGQAVLLFDWSVDGGITYPITSTNPATFSNINNSVYSIVIAMKVRNDVAPGGIIYRRTLINPFFGTGGGV